MNKGSRCIPAQMNKGLRYIPAQMKRGSRCIPAQINEGSRIKNLLSADCLSLYSHVEKSTVDKIYLNPLFLNILNLRINFCFLSKNWHFQISNLLI